MVPKPMRSSSSPLLLAAAGTLYFVLFNSATIVEGRFSSTPWFHGPSGSSSAFKRGKPSFFKRKIRTIPIADTHLIPQFVARGGGDGGFGPSGRSDVGQPPVSDEASSLNLPIVDGARGGGGAVEKKRRVAPPPSASSAATVADVSPSSIDEGDAPATSSSSQSVIDELYVHRTSGGSQLRTNEKSSSPAAAAAVSTKEKTTTAVSTKEKTTTAKQATLSSSSSPLVFDEKQPTLTKEEKKLIKEEKKAVKKLMKEEKKRHKLIAKKLKPRNATNKRRKFLHFSWGMLFAGLNHFVPREVFLPSMVAVTTASMVVEMLRYRKNFGWMNTTLHWFLGKALRKSEMDGKFTGSFYYFSGVTLTSFLYPKTCATLGICQLAVADPTASYFGKLTRNVYWSRIHNGFYGVGRNKGILGFLGGGVSCVPLNYRLLTLACRSVKDTVVPKGVIAAVSLALGLAGAFADLLVPSPALTLPKTKVCGVQLPPFHLDDNFFVPVFSGWASILILNSVPGMSPDMPLAKYVIA